MQSGGPNWYYHTKYGWTWEQWQLRDTTYSPGLQAGALPLDAV